MGKCIAADIWRTSLHLRDRADLCQRGVQDSSVQVQPDHSLLDPLRVASSAHGSPSLNRSCPIPLINHSRFQMPPTGCERFHDDIAVFAVGALGGAEKGRLLRHLDGCTRCEALRKEYSETAETLEALISVGSESCQLVPRIIKSIRGRPQVPFRKRSCRHSVGEAPWSFLWRYYG